jgi:hypothetical protein
VPFERAYEPEFEDMARRLPDISKIGRLIGYRPTLDLPVMLERIIAYERAVRAHHAVRRMAGVVAQPVRHAVAREARAHG